LTFANNDFIVAHAQFEDESSCDLVAVAEDAVLHFVLAFGGAHRDPDLEFGQLELVEVVEQTGFLLVDHHLHHLVMHLVFSVIDAEVHFPKVFILFLEFEPLACLSLGVQQICLSHYTENVGEVG